MDVDHILVKGCPLCSIFLDDDIHTTLHYPDREDINNVDFVIVDCDTCKVPMIVIRDHVTDVSKELWGRILYQSRRMFGNVQLRCKPRKLHQHYHCHIVKNIRS